MDLLRRLFHWFQEPQELKGFLSSTLSKVPKDVLICFMDFLPLESAVAFSLTCKHLYHSVGTRHFAEMSSRIHKLALLELLAIDLHDQVACSSCMRLHKFKNFHRYLSSTYDSGYLSYLSIPACLTQDRNTRMYEISNLFGTTTFKMIMKIHRQGSDCSRLLKAISGQAKTIEQEYYLLSYTEECRIFKGRLMHKLHRVYLPRRQSDLIRHPPYEMICPHLFIQPSLQDIETEKSRMMRCQKCRTECRTAFHRFGSYGPALVVSRWKDLGPGPENKIWTQHIPPKPLASLRNAFIGNGNTSVEVRTEEVTWTQEEYPHSLFADDGGEDFIFQFLLRRENQTKLLRLQQRN